MNIPPPAFRVLVCEDQALVRADFVTILSAQPGMEAVDGREAVRSARELKPDVVVMDIRMPLLVGKVLTPASTRSSSSSARACRTPKSPTEPVIGHETVKTYVPRILTTLDLRDRVQAVVLAYRAGLTGKRQPSLTAL